MFCKYVEKVISLSAEIVKLYNFMIMRTINFLSVMFTIMLVFAACSSNDNKEFNNGYDNKTITLEAREYVLVDESNDFAFNLFREISKQGGTDKNLVISPLSITYALGMLNNGATGETQTQINKVLGFSGQGADGINEFCHKMIVNAPKLDSSTKVMLSNAIFLSNKYQLKDEFRNKAITYYDATLETCNFEDMQTLNTINLWAKNHTEGLVDKVLNERDYNKEAVSYLLNATYFKGSWATKFDKSATREMEFQTYTEQAYPRVLMMHINSDFGYAEDNDSKVLSLPYGNGAYEMTILLPKDGKTVFDLMQTLSTEKWKQYSTTLHKNVVEVDVMLPRFECEAKTDLKEVMSALGMPLAFAPEKAEFRNFCTGNNIFINKMSQSAKIKVDEEGTEAAAVTIVEGAATAMPQKYVYANRPFLYIISERSTGTIFFIGKYMGS